MSALHYSNFYHGFTLLGVIVVIVAAGFYIYLFERLIVHAVVLTGGLFFKWGIGNACNYAEKKRNPFSYVWGGPHR
jgi:hypothetical protein